MGKKAVLHPIEDWTPKDWEDWVKAGCPIWAPYIRGCGCL